MRRAIAFGVTMALACLTGCGGTKDVPVSGVVKLNGEPYKGAVVSFQPVGGKGAENAPGRGSSAETDENGRFTLVYDDEKPGALVGIHRVRIFTKLGGGIPDTEGAPRRPPSSPSRRRRSSRPAAVARCCWS